jgi:RNA ligase (TIGR02306 family)
MENLNSVCYVGRIGEIRPIEGADNIELAIVNGWHAITKKGQHNVDEQVIVATTDAVIPLTISDDLGVTGYLRKGQRVRTVKLRGVYSECLIMPMDLLVFIENINDGDDMMETLGVVKYEPPVKMVEMSVGGRKFKYHQNPNFHVYYKFPNMKNVPDLFAEEDKVSITRKLHGTNARYGIVKKKKLSLWDRVRKFFGNEWVEFEYVYGSHNVEKGSTSQGFYSTDVWRTVAEQYDIQNKLWNYVKKYFTPERLGTGMVIYGEIYGHGIQKNYDYGLSDIRFAGFDIEIDGVYQEFFSERGIFVEMDLPKVEMLYIGNWNRGTQDSFVFGNFIEGTKVPHEGIVVKCLSGERHKVAKVINPDYLIYGEKNNVGDSH